LSSLLEVEALTKKFKKVLAVNKVSFKVNNGEIFGILGASDSGKTTLMRMLSTILPPTQGSIKICDINAVDNPRQAREMIGVFSRECHGLYENLTVRENIDYFASLHNVPREEINDRIESLIE
jgi:sodium transport system ATP-binding protein